MTIHCPRHTVISNSVAPITHSIMSYSTLLVRKTNRRVVVYRILVWLGVIAAKIDSKIYRKYDQHQDFGSRKTFPYLTRNS
jgi:hypothetical protein